jgi:two-component system, cell cycle response regulator
MLSRSMLAQSEILKSAPRVLLVSPDSALLLDLHQIFSSLGLRTETVTNDEAAASALASISGSGIGIIVLDVHLPEIANGRLLARIHESGARRHSAVALIAEEVSDEWIARLREGVIDDIVPRSADVTAWNTHLNIMQRGHQLHCELQQLKETALEEIQYDRLTGAFNRETMLSVLFRETDRVQRLRGELCLVVFDVDDFAHWNNELGRDACDRLLREVAKRTGRILRSYDLLGRTGKDEFLLALPGCSTINAVMLAERLRMDVFGEPFAVQNGPADAVPVRLTACFGITSSRGRSPVVVLREAEETLAQGKLRGPDSILCASESPLSAESAGDCRHLFPEAQFSEARHIA